MIKSVFHVNINVKDFDRSLEFYKNLGFGGKFCCFKDPDGTFLELIEPFQKRELRVQIPGGSIITLKPDARA